LQGDEIGVECFSEGLSFEKGNYVEFAGMSGVSALNKDFYNTMEHDKYQ